MLEPKVVQRFTYPLILPSQRDEASRWIHWLVRLRWIAVAAQAVVIAFMVSVLSRPALTATLLYLVIFATCVWNADVLAKLEREHPFDRFQLPIQLSLDVAELTAVLALAGGATNPFVVLLMIHVALAVVVLSGWGAVLVIGAILGAYALLHVLYLPLDLAAHPLGAPLLQGVGAWLAFAVTAITLGAVLRAMVLSLR